MFNENILSVQKDQAVRMSYAKIYQDNLPKISEIVFEDNTTSKDNIYTYFPIFVSNMEKLRSYLIKNNIDVGPQHYKNTANLDSFSDFYKECPIANMVSNNLLLLPTYPRYGLKNVKKIVDTINNFYKFKLD